MCTLDACCYCIFLDIGCMIIAALILVSTNLNYKFKTVLKYYTFTCQYLFYQWKLRQNNYNVLLVVTSFVYDYFRSVFTYVLKNMFLMNVSQSYGPRVQAGFLFISCVVHLLKLVSFTNNITHYLVDRAKQNTNYLYTSELDYFESYIPLLMVTLSNSDLCYVVLRLVLSESFTMNQFYIC